MNVHQRAEKCERLMEKLAILIANQGYEHKGLIWDLERLESLMQTMSERLELMRKGIGY